MIGYFLLNDTLPNPGWPGFIAFALIFAGVASVVVRWLRARSLPETTRRAIGTPPLGRMLLASLALSWLSWLLVAKATNDGIRFVAFLFVIVGLVWGSLLSFLGPTVSTLVGGMISWMGIFGGIWWLIQWRRGPMAAASEPSTEPASRSIAGACGRCRAAAEAGMGEPLVRVGHSSEGPRFLYRCSSCHSYWLRELGQTGVVSAIKARQLFPDSVL